MVTVDKDCHAAAMRYLKNKTPENLDKLARSSDRYIKGALRKYKGHADYDDLIAEAKIELVTNAITKYDVSRGYRFTTYLTHRVRGRVSHYFRDKSSAIIIPSWYMDRVKRYGKLKQENPEITDEELATTFKTTVSNVKRLRHVAESVGKHPLSFENLRRDIPDMRLDRGDAEVPLVASVEGVEEVLTAMLSSMPTTKVTALISQYSDKPVTYSDVWNLRRKIKDMQPDKLLASA